MSIVDEIYDGVTDTEAFAALPARIACLVNARSCTLQSFSPDNAFQFMAHNGYFTAEMHDFYVATAMHHHDPWRGPCEQKEHLNRASSCQDLVSLEDYERSIFYNEFFRRFGDDTRHCLGSVMTHRHGMGLLGLHRGPRSEPFSAADVAAVQPLVSHLRRLFTVKATIAAAHSELIEAEAVLDALPQAVLVVDHASRLRFANRRGEELFAVGGTLANRGGAVRARDPGADRLLAALIGSAARGEGPHGGAMRLTGDDARTLRVVVVPWRTAERTRVVILIDDPMAGDPSMTAKLSGVYGLTPAEAETVAALADGLSPAATAEARGVSIATVRTQIQQALRKSDVSSLAELVRLAASLPRLDLPH